MKERGRKLRSRRRDRANDKRYMMCAIREANKRRLPVIHQKEGDDIKDGSIAFDSGIDPDGHASVTAVYFGEDKVELRTFWWGFYPDSRRWSSYPSPYSTKVPPWKQSVKERK